MSNLDFKTNKLNNQILNKNFRNSWIELYRYFAITFVILIHVLHHTYNSPSNLMELKNSYWQILLPFLKTSVAFFFLVTIYYNYNQSFRLPKFSIWILFYSLIGIVNAIIQKIIYNDELGFLTRNWFIWLLVIIHVMSFLFNNGIDKIKKQYLLLSVILTGIGFIIWTIMSDFQFNQYHSIENYGSLSGYIMGIIFLFLLINYIRHFYPNFFLNKKTIIFAVLIVIIFIFYFLIYSILKSNHLNVKWMLYLIISQVDPLGFIFILSIFIILLNLKNNIKIFLFLGKLSNGMFLLHFTILNLLGTISKFLTFKTFLNLDYIILIVWFIAIIISTVLSFIFQILFYPLFERQIINFFNLIFIRNKKSEAFQRQTEKDIAQMKADETEEEETKRKGKKMK